jgi:hypothetical protein
MDVLIKDRQAGVSRRFHPREVVGDPLVLQDPKWTCYSLDQPGLSQGMRLVAANAPLRLWVPLLPGFLLDPARWVPSASVLYLSYFIPVDYTQIPKVALNLYCAYLIENDCYLCILRVGCQSQMWC